MVSLREPWGVTEEEEDEKSVVEEVAGGVPRKKEKDVVGDATEVTAGTQVGDVDQTDAMGRHTGRWGQ